jgi:hypothetical protein
MTDVTQYRLLALAAFALLWGVLVVVRAKEGGE